MSFSGEIEKETMVSYLNADGGWLGGFFGFTQMSTDEIKSTINDMTKILEGEITATFPSILSIHAFSDLNLSYHYRIFNSIGFSYLANWFFNEWSLKSFGDRNYIRFINDITNSFNESFVKNTPAVINLTPLQKKNFLLHSENMLIYGVKTAKNIYTKPSARDIIMPFENVKNGILFGASVDETSKKLVSQAIVADIESLEYTYEILRVGPLRRGVYEKIFRLFHKTFETVEGL